MKKIELEIVALSSSASPNHFYAVVLGELNGARRLPIVIGTFEAQAIVVALEKIQPTRPLTHDLFYNFMLAFNIELEEVLIHKIEEGVFFSKLFCRQGDKSIEIDSRTSDALALAIRVGCPIYTYDNILKVAGMMMESSTHEHTSAKLEKSPQTDPKPQPEEEKKDELTQLSIAELENRLKEVLEQEDYMSAVAIRDEIKKRKGEG